MRQFMTFLVLRGDVYSDFSLKSWRMKTSQPGLRKLGFVRVFFVTSVSFLFFVLVIKKIDLSNLVAVTGKCLDDQGKLMQNLPLGEGKPILFWFQANKCIFVL